MKITAKQLEALKQEAYRWAMEYGQVSNLRAAAFADKCGREWKLAVAFGFDYMATL
jgi:hypothetical protein